MERIGMSGIAGLATIIVLLIRRKKYFISYRMMVSIMIIVGIMGYLGATTSSYLAFENWQGIRFYGRILFAVYTLLGMSILCKAEWKGLVNYYAPADIVALIIMKFNCLRTGCCSGIILNYSGKQVQFPCQIGEIVVAVIILIVIFLMEHSSRWHDYQYSFMLVGYGLTRYIFDFLRKSKGNIISIGNIGMTVGQVFCLLLIVTGILMYRKIQKDGGVESRCKGE